MRIKPPSNPSKLPDIDVVGCSAIGFACIGYRLVIGIAIIKTSKNN